MTTILESARSVQELHHRLASAMKELPSAGLGELMAVYLAGRGELAALPIKSPVDGLAILHLARQAIAASTQRTITGPVRAHARDIYPLRFVRP